MKKQNLIYPGERFEKNGLYTAKYSGDAPEGLKNPVFALIKFTNGYELTTFHVENYEISQEIRKFARWALPQIDYESTVYDAKVFNRNEIKEIIPK